MGSKTRKIPLSIRFASEQLPIMETRADNLGINTNEFVRRLTSSPSEYTNGAILSKRAGRPVISAALINLAIEAVGRFIEGNPSVGWGNDTAIDWNVHCDALLKQAWNFDDDDDDVRRKLLELLADVPAGALDLMQSEINQIKEIAQC